MAATDNQVPNETKRPSLEFWLVVVMLGVLTFLVMVVIFTKKDWIGGTTDIAIWRKDVLSLIITAFGAWVGAGAAYFFGRENLRVAADSLLAMRGLSAKERLSQTSIKQIPPTPIDWTVDSTTAITAVQAELMAKPERWFVPVVKADGTLETVVNEEAVWRYLIAGNPPAAATVADLLTFIAADPALARFNQIHVVVAMETTVGAANDLMDTRHVFLAIVTSNGKPTHFFTTSEVRKLLLQG